MTKEFIIIENSHVVNTIMCDSLELAESITGLTAVEYEKENFVVGIGYTYNNSTQAFTPPKPYPSWILNEQTNEWESPNPGPMDGNSYNWDEETTSWIQVQP